MTEKDDAFQNLADDVEVPGVVVFTQYADEYAPGYDIVGDIELDEAIAMALKGLVLMVLESVSVLDVDDEEDDPPAE